jgi:acyl-[acyl-carrier-protein]-phospholipid O-acyltransferase/long-chain-fatty-acid--[acyl-carrier-protein] ligase
MQTTDDKQADDSQSHLGVSGLLSSKRFLPLFLTQFLGAMNDNFYKQALIILVTYQLAKQNNLDAASLTALAGAVLILPFLLFSSIAGRLADKYDKAALIRKIKFCEIIIMGFAGAALYYQNLFFLYLVLFFLGLQSTFFGPLKYATLPFHLSKHELLAGNALIEGGTFLAILFGSIIGGLVVSADYGLSITTIGMLSVAIIGWLASRAILPAAAPNPDTRISVNIFADSLTIIKQAFSNTRVKHSLLAISWFWAVGAIVLALLPIIAEEILRADETVATLFMALFSIAIGIGSLYTNKKLNGEISCQYSAIGMWVISIALVALYFILPLATVDSSTERQLLTGITFFTVPINYLLLLILFIMGFAVGPYITPLYALMQHAADPQYKGITIAASNIINSFFIVFSALLLIVCKQTLKLSVAEICFITAIVNIMAFINIKKLLKLEETTKHESNF